jgi:hypothetical protein
MSNHLSILESAIADVGYWRWWAHKLPTAFQVEFGGVQLWNPPTEKDGPPSGVVALRFGQPTVIAFLTSDEINTPPDWRNALHEDRIDPFSVSNDAITLQSEELLDEVVTGSTAEYILGNESDLLNRTAPVKLAFRAGPVCLVVRAQDLTVITSSGELNPEQIQQSSDRWWSYWREYWDQRATDAPMPKDYACEVTIPLASA